MTNEELVRILAFELVITWLYLLCFVYYHHKTRKP
jgi:hypothetical protein